jgi:GalNAc-alpha-(1->4)-GalNAc-alpha-(1->3)-diNAcBac-PP-undecaprenol alpha-1,4-N-acetyl-D-galactosaminyltransferase
MRSTKVCVVGPCLTMGGMERASSTLANVFSRMEFDVLYLAIFKHPVFFKLDDRISFSEPTDGSNTNSLNLFRTVIRIRKEVKKFNPESVLAFNKLYAALTVLALAGTKYPVYISERSSPLYKWKASLRILMRVIFSVLPPTGVIAQTQQAAAYQRKYYNRSSSIHVIPNALRPINEYSISKEDVVIAVGRLNDRLKGFDRLIRSFALLKNKSWKLLFAGDTRGADHLKVIVEELNLSDRVIFYGKVSDIDRIYRMGKIFVIPSRSEGFPNALCEAMAAGLPCISYDFIAGPAEIIDPNINGVLVPEGDIKGLALAIDALIENPVMRDSLSREAVKIVHKLNETVIANEFLDVILRRRANGAQ